MKSYIRVSLYISYYTKHSCTFLKNVCKSNYQWLSYLILLYLMLFKLQGSLGSRNLITKITISQIHLAVISGPPATWQQKYTRTEREILLLLIETCLLCDNSRGRLLTHGLLTDYIFKNMGNVGRLGLMKSVCLSSPNNTEIKYSIVLIIPVVTKQTTKSCEVLVPCITM